MADRSWTEAHRGTVGVLLMAGIVIVGAGVKLAAPVLVPLVLGVLVATVTSPLVVWLMRRGVPRGGAIAVAVLADTAALTALGALVVRSAGELSRQMPMYVALIAESMLEVDAALRRVAPSLSLPDLVDPGAAMGVATSLLGDLAGVIWNVFIALVIAVFLLLEAARPGTGEMGPTVVRSEPMRRAIGEINKYIAIKTATSAGTGLSVGLWLWLLGGDLPVLFGLLGFLLNYIPNIGSILAAAPAIGLALLHYGTGRAALVAAGYFLVNVIVGNFIEPRVMGRALGLTPLVVLLSVIVWGWLLGPVGALLSALLTVMVKLVLSSTEDLRHLALVLGPPRTHPPGQQPGGDEELADLVVPQARSDEPE